MNVNPVGQAVDIWALKTIMASGQTQALSSVTNQITNNLASLDPNLGQNLDISI